jgi:putative polyketide hydroxylase
MEVMRVLGLEETIRSTPSAVALAHNDTVITTTSLAGRELASLRAPYFMGGRRELGGLSPTGWCQCHQAEVEPILRGRARELGARVDHGIEMTDFHQDGERVVVTLKSVDDGAEETLSVGHLIAADGARSGVRERLGIPFDGTGPFGRFANIHFRADLTAPLGDRRFIMAYVFNERVRGGLMPLDNAENWLLHLIVDPDDGEELPSAEQCRAFVRAASGIPDLAVEILGVAPWEASARIAGRFREGRVLLAGDAAHVMPPTGSFGANTGILEMHNLAWKLAAVHAGQASEALLDTYEAERRPAAAATVEQAVLRNRDRRRLADAPESAPDQRIVPDPVVWFGACYAPGEGPWAARPDGRPGTRAPHVPWPAPDPETRSAGPRSAGGSVLDLFGLRFVLLTGTGPAATGWHAAAGRLPVDAHRLPDAAACAAYGIATDGAVLVRPDGYVAWRSRTAVPDPVTAVERAMTAVLHRS